MRCNLEQLQELFENIPFYKDKLDFWKHHHTKEYTEWETQLVFDGFYYGFIQTNEFIEDRK